MKLSFTTPCRFNRRTEAVMKFNPSTRIFKNQKVHSLARMACTLVIFSAAMAIASEAQSQNIFVRFVNANGGSPTSLVQGADGNFYGVGIVGGNQGGGSIFKVTPAGVVTRLHVFCPVQPCLDGKGPNGLVLASDGNFYGVTGAGGEGFRGSIFQVTPAGTVNTLYNFGIGLDGAGPTGELIQGSDGDLYGTTISGGEHDGGTVFKITLSGVFTSLYSFCSQPNCADGDHPEAGLVEAANGMFYGTTSAGGTGGSCTRPPFFRGCGTLFRISPSGKLATLYSFCAQPNCGDGLSPETSLIQAADGKIYGTTRSGGLMEGNCGFFGGCGVAFRIPPSGGPYTLLHSFTSSEGAQVQTLIQATDGSFYGTALFGGSSNLGTLFKMDSAGSVTVLLNFCNNAPCKYSTNPVGFMQATNGLFYGTTLGPGSGTLFTFGFPPFITMSPTSGPIGTMVRIYGTDLTGATEVTFNGGVPATFTIVSPGEITTSVPVGALFGPVRVTTPAATLLSNGVFRITH
jgi:uncharacterized repeat protein (TIGR03803 family)